MSTNEVDNQPLPIVEDASPKVPGVKSGVHLNRAAPPPPARFFKNDIVHMRVTINGQRTKRNYIVIESRYNSSEGYHEYELEDIHTQLIHSAWPRERELKLERRG